MNRSTILIVLAAICSLPVMTDFATTEKNPEIFYVSSAVMVILFLTGIFYWKKDGA
tara:strand:- start:113 stop:280 length:168 start_codon:yes stop_codon:yes gene_type:complete